jgi:hypothetical protein
MPHASKPRGLHRYPSFHARDLDAARAGVLRAYGALDVDLVDDPRGFAWDAGGHRAGVARDVAVAEGSQLWPA